jgi:hypothetical protein
LGRSTHTRAQHDESAADHTKNSEFLCLHLVPLISSWTRELVCGNGTATSKQTREPQRGLLSGFCKKCQEKRSSLICRMRILRSQQCERQPRSGERMQPTAQAVGIHRKIPSPEGAKEASEAEMLVRRGATQQHVSLAARDNLLCS